MITTLMNQKRGLNRFSKLNPLRALIILMRNKGWVIPRFRLHFTDPLDSAKWSQREILQFAAYPISWIIFIYALGPSYTDTCLNSYGYKLRPFRS